MTQFKRVGVFLTGSPADRVALGYAGKLVGLTATERIACVYTSEGGPEARGEQKLDEARLRQLVADALPPELTREVEVEIRTVKGFDELLHVARDRELDLIVKGRRLPSHQASSGPVYTKLARRSPCYVLIVPNHSRPHFSRLLVPVDFSNHSKLALREALDLARAGAASTGEEPQILIQHVAPIAYAYQKQGLTFDQVMRQQEQACAQRVKEFLADVDVSGAQVEHVYTCSEDIAAAAIELTAARKMDLILIGSRGLTAAAAAILGSTAEQILLRSPHPVMVIKEKGEVRGLLDALLGR